MNTPVVEKYKARHENTNFVKHFDHIDMYGTNQWSGYACFDCRIYNKRYDGSLVSNFPLCYKCKKQMIFTGEKFRPPPYSNVKDWENTRLLVGTGIFCYKVYNHRCLPGTSQYNPEKNLRKHEAGYYDQQQRIIQKTLFP